MKEQLPNWCAAKLPNWERLCRTYCIRL